MALGFDPVNLEAQFSASFVATVALSGQALAFEVMAGFEVGPQGGLQAELSGQTLSTFVVNKWLTLNFLEISATIVAEDVFPTNLGFASRWAAQRGTCHWRWHWYEPRGPAVGVLPLSVTKPLHLPLLLCLPPPCSETILGSTASTAIAYDVNGKCRRAWAGSFVHMPGSAIHGAVDATHVNYRMYLATFMLLPLMARACPGAPLSQPTAYLLICLSALLQATARPLVWLPASTTSTWPKP